MKVNEVSLLKFSNGEEIVCKIKTIGVGEVEIEKPLAVMYNFQEGNLTFGFAPIPWLPLALDLVVNRDHILVEGKPNDMLLQAYQKATGVIITPPEKKLLV